MAIKQESIKHDLRGLCHQIGQLDPETVFVPMLYCDRKKYPPADAERICSVLQSPRRLSTFIYLAGHTELQLPDGQLAYAPADWLDASNPDQPQHIPYDTIRSWLLDGQHLAPLLFVTEACQCDNFLRLPYVLQREGNEMRWEKTEFYDTFKQNLYDVVHLAATSPGELSVSFESTGAIFTKVCRTSSKILDLLISLFDSLCADSLDTQALCNINWSEMLSLKEIMVQLQENINKILSSRQSHEDQQSSQHPVVYCSRIMDELHLFATLEFCPSKAPEGSRVPDSDGRTEATEAIPSHPALQPGSDVEVDSTRCGSSSPTIHEGEKRSRSPWWKRLAKWKRLGKTLCCGLL